MTNPDKTAYYDQLGDQFEAFMSDYDVDRRHVLIFEQLLGDETLEHRHVLEIGSGTGRFSRTIVDQGGELTALDIGPGLVTALTQKLTCRGVAGDALSLPFADAAFDVVISSECIEHTLDPILALREMCRVCRPGGVVCVTTPNRLWYPVLFVSQKLKIRKYSGIENWISPQQAASTFRDIGMRNVELSGCHLWPFQFRFTRPLLSRIDEYGSKLYPMMINFGVRGRKQSE
jgi:ubiquinone/menaquinone biosynthesis C-methylase UbiE